MTDCPNPCINNDYAEKTKLFNILESENDDKWNQLISKLVNNPIVKNNLISTSEHDLQFKWSHEDKSLIMITQIDNLIQTAIQTVKNKLYAFGFQTVTDSVDMDFYNFIGPWYSDCDEPRIETKGCIDQLINPSADGVKKDTIITQHVENYIIELTNVLKYMLTKIDEISKDKDKSDSHDYFILIRNMAGIKKGSAVDAQDAKLVAESWHKDYLWAPAEFSSIIYYKNLILKDDQINYPPDIYNEPEIVAEELSNQQKLEIIKFRGIENWKEDTNISGADFCLTPLFINEVGLNYFFNQEEIGNYFRDLFFEFVKQEAIQNLSSNKDSELIKKIKEHELYDIDVQDELSSRYDKSEFELEVNIFDEISSLLNSIFKDLNYLTDDLKKIEFNLESIDDMEGFITLKPSIIVGKEIKYKGTILGLDKEEGDNKYYNVINKTTDEIESVIEKDIIITLLDIINAVKKYYRDNTEIIKISSSEDTPDEFIIRDLFYSTIIATPIIDTGGRIYDSIKMIKAAFKSFHTEGILKDIFSIPKYTDVDDEKLEKFITENIDVDNLYVFKSIETMLNSVDKRAIYLFMNEFSYLINFINFINSLLNSMSKGISKPTIKKISEIRQNILYIDSLIPSYDYEDQTEPSKEYSKLPYHITKRDELIIAIKKPNLLLKAKENWLKGRIVFFSKEHFYVRLEEIVVQDVKRTRYISGDKTATAKVNEIADELIYTDDSWIPKVQRQIKKYCPYPSDNACIKLNWDDYGTTWKIPLANLNPAKISTPWYSGPDVFNQDLNNFINKSDDRRRKDIVRKSKIIIGSKINLEAESRFAQKMAIEKRTGGIDDNYKLRNNKKNIYKNSVGCSPHKYYIPKVKLNDALIWDNQNTVHRSPFMESTKTVIRSFLNIRFLKKDEDRPHPYVSKDMDMSQLMA